MTHSSHRWGVWNGEGMPWNSLETKQRPSQIPVLFQEQASTSALSGDHVPPRAPKVRNCYRDRERGNKGNPDGPTRQNWRSPLPLTHAYDLGWVPQSGPPFPICNLGLGPGDSEGPCSSNIHEVAIRGKRNKLRRFGTSRHHHNLLFCLRKLNKSGSCCLYPRCL